MTTALAKASAGGALAKPAITDDLTMQQIASACASSGFFQDTREAAQALVKIQAGRELGIPPVASMTGIHVIKGKVAIGATMMGALVQRSGAYDFRVIESTDAACRIEFYKGRDKLGTSEFTMAHATRAGIAGGDNWRKYPKAMLRNRAMAEGVRTYCPGVLNGPAYLPDELGARIDADGEVPTDQAPRPEPKPSGVSAINATITGKPVVEAPTVEAEPHADESKVADAWAAAAAEAQRAPTNDEKRMFADRLRKWSGLHKDDDKTACQSFAAKCGKMLGQIGDLRDMEATIKDHEENKRTWFDVMNPKV